MEINEGSSFIRGVEDRLNTLLEKIPSRVTKKKGNPSPARRNILA